MSVNGPMAKTLEDISLFAKTVVDSEPWKVDPKVLPIPWRSVEHKKRLKIAVLWNDGMVVPTPPVTRALKETVEKLKIAGHEIIEWDPVLHPQLLETLVSDMFMSSSGSYLTVMKGKMFVADGGKSVQALLAPSDEPFRPEMVQYKEAVELGVHGMWQLQADRSELQRQYLDQWTAQGGLDAILGKSVCHRGRSQLTDLAPTTPYSSVQHGGFKYVGYTGVFNVVDYSAVSFPCGVTADKQRDRPIANHSALSPYCKDVHDECKTIRFAK
jgi:amidase